MPRKVWVYDPQSGGVKIPKAVQPGIRQRILAHAEKHYAGKYNRIDVRFNGQFCYIDAYTEPYMPRRYNPKVFIVLALAFSWVAVGFLYMNNKRH